MDAQRLKSVPLFASLASAQRNRLAVWLDEIDLPEGKRLLEQGTFAYEFVILVSGTAAVFADERHLNDMGPGDFFGEIALLDLPRRTASVVTTSPVRAIVMTGPNFRAMMRELPEVAQHVRSAADERLRRSSQVGGNDPPGA